MLTIFVCICMWLCWQPQLQHFTCTLSPHSPHLVHLCLHLQTIDICPYLCNIDVAVRYRASPETHTPIHSFLFSLVVPTPENPKALAGSQLLQFSVFNICFILLTSPPWLPCLSFSRSSSTCYHSFSHSVFTKNPSHNFIANIFNVNSFGAAWWLSG